MQSIRDPRRVEAPASSLRGKGLVRQRFNSKPTASGLGTTRRLPIHAAAGTSTLAGVEHGVMLSVAMGSARGLFDVSGG